MYEGTVKTHRHDGLLDVWTPSKRTGSIQQPEGVQPQKSQTNASPHATASGAASLFIAALKAVKSGFYGIEASSAFPVYAEMAAHTT